MSLFTDLTAAIAARLASDDYFATPPAIGILTERAGDLEHTIARALQKIGVGLLILTPKIARGGEPNILQVVLTIHLIEHVTINQSASGTKKPASDIAATAIALLENWAPDDIWSPLRFISMTLIDPGKTIVYELELHTHTLLATA
jgi:hypothetical protein